MTVAKQTGQEGSSSSSATPAISAQGMNSLLAQALEVPSLDHTTTKSATAAAASIATNRSISAATSPTAPIPIARPASASTPASSAANVLSPASPPADLMQTSIRSIGDSLHSPMTLPPEESMLAQHSDFTIPTSNAARFLHSGVTPLTSHAKKVDFAAGPPLEIPPDPDESARRSVFATPVKKRYRVPTAAEKAQLTPNLLTPSPATPYQDNADADAATDIRPPLNPASSSSPESPPTVSYMVGKLPMPAISPLTPATGLRTTPATKATPSTSRTPQHYNSIAPQTPTGIYGTASDRDLNDLASCLSPDKGTTFHETIHAQSLLLGLAFMAVWSPNNAMAPNLTQMAESFGMNEAERDLYLGSYCALALGVFSLPISALIGFMADFYSRKWLFVACVVGGALSSAWTGWSQTFVSLFLARLWNGGCMSASVPVAFSLLGDLFATEERNAASSGLTAMMGLGIILGQVYAGTVGPAAGWQFPFFVSALLSGSAALCVVIWVREPARGAKEKALQEMLESGKKYDRQLTLSGFVHAMRHNQSNAILLWQGFFTSVPWGVVFVFLNDYLSQEKGFSVPDATFMVMLFGVGTAIGGISGGYIGQVCQEYNRSYLPLFMSVSTFLGMLPFLGLLNSNFPNKHGYKAMAYSILAGTVASLPSVNARPCLINVNPPETRGAALTASNLLITLGRGVGPSCITLLGLFFNMSRQSSFNITLALFWTITAIQLLFLAKTLPHDEDKMEAELARYAAAWQQADDVEGDDGTKHPVSPAAATPRRTIGGEEQANGEGIETVLLTPPSPNRPASVMTPSRSIGGTDGGESLVSIEEYMTSFDGKAARSSIQFVRLGMKEIQEELSNFATCGGRNGGATSPTTLEYNFEDPRNGATNGNTSSLMDEEHGKWQQEQRLLQQEEEKALREILSEEELLKRKDMWQRQRRQQEEEQQRDETKTEQTPLLGNA